MKRCLIIKTGRIFKIKSVRLVDKEDISINLAPSFYPSMDNDQFSKNHPIYGDLPKFRKKITYYELSNGKSYK